MDRRRRVEGLRLKGIGSPLRIWAGIWTGRFGPEDRFAIPQGLGDRHNGLVDAFADDRHNGNDDWQQEHDRIRHERDQGEAFLKRPRTVTEQEANTRDQRICRSVCPKFEGRSVTGSRWDM